MAKNIQNFWAPFLMDPNFLFPPHINKLTVPQKLTSKFPVTWAMKILNDTI